MLIGTTVLLSVIFFLPNTPVFDSMPDWWKKTMPDRGMNMGLDLQGGIHLVFEVEGDKAVEITTDRVMQTVKDALGKKKMQADLKREGLIINVNPPSSELKSAIDREFPNLVVVDAGQKLSYRLTDMESKRIKDNATEQAVETIRNRIDKFGLREPIIQKQGENEIVVQLPGEKDRQRAIDMIGKTALLEFRIVDDIATSAAQLPASIGPGEEAATLEKFKDKVPEDCEILFERVIGGSTKAGDTKGGEIKKVPFIVKKNSVLTGDLLNNASVGLDNRFNRPYISISFNSAGAKIFDEVTGANVSKRLAIVLDGSIYSAPSIRERISGGNAQIDGTFTMQEAKDLSIVLKTGALPAPVKTNLIVEVGPSLGRDSIDAGKLAGLIGALGVIIFMAFYYKISGLIADVALVLNIILLIGAMAYFNATLTLPGIAGIILAIGMAVDSNVLMFERMREELRAGKTPRAAVDSGYDKAFWTIFDSHVTTLITGGVLYFFGTGPIKGFAVSLSLGVAINLFTALVGTKTIFDILHSKQNVKELSI